MSLTLPFRRFHSPKIHSEPPPPSFTENDTSMTKTALLGSNGTPQRHNPKDRTDLVGDSTSSMTITPGIDPTSRGHAQRRSSSQLSSPGFAFSTNDAIEPPTTSIVSAERNGSVKLSLKDLYTAGGEDEALQQTEYFDDDGTPSEVSSFGERKMSMDTPPSSLHNTPTGPAVLPAPVTIDEGSALLPPPASSATSSSLLENLTIGSHTMVSSSASARNHQGPALYSAIGSLEDTTGSFYRHRTTHKFEFPSTRLLQPPRKSNHTVKAKAELVSAAGDLARPRTSILRNARKTDATTPSTTSTTLTKQPKKVQIDRAAKPRKKKVKEMFRPSSDAYTPRMGKKEIKYKPAEMRTPVPSSDLGTLQRPNFRDALRRVAMIIHQHIVKIEQRFETQKHGLFAKSMKQEFDEDQYITPKYKCSMVRVPMARPGMVFGLKQIRQEHKIPSEEEIFEFAHQLFNTVQLSSECSIVCLIYVERLMEAAKVPLLASTWRPIFMCGLLLASKVWQDLASWNIEFASVYPQYSLDAINRMELKFLRMVKWDLYISSSVYAKYYFALRSLVEKPDFRQRYNRMVGGVGNVQVAEALKIEKRTEQVKEEALLQLSRSM